MLINPCHEASVNADDSEVQKLIETGKVQEQSPQDDDEKKEDGSYVLRARNEKYEKMIKMVPGPLKDHMPDFYLQPLVRLFEKEKNGESFQK